jgi:ABC-type multidrug transport system ATPase subunit
VQATCDAVVIMARGRVRASGTPAALVASKGSTRYIAVVAPTAGDSAAGADAAAALATVPGVAAVSHEPLPTTTAGGRRGVKLTVTPANTAGDLHEALAFALQRASQARGPLAWLTTELRRQEPTLEEVFMSVVTDVPAPSEAAA